MPPNSKRVVFDEKVDKAGKDLDEANVKLKSSEYIEDTQDPFVLDANVEPKDVTTLEPREYKIEYKNVLVFAYLHMSGLYGGYIALTSAQALTVLFGVAVLIVATLGITAGVHRLWSHHSYKAKLPLQILLMVLNSIAYQNTIINWARDHRMHHKYADTDSDPHDPRRGFFFSHIGYMMVKKHPAQLRKSHLLDTSDLYANPVLQFQHKYALPWITFWCFIFPVVIPMWAWNENFNNAWHVNAFRYMMSLNITLSVNSLTHALGFGYKPYDRSISASQSCLVSFLMLGEGFHNYHHVFPWDYRTSELGNKMLNLTTVFINACAKIGWAYDLRIANEDMIRARQLRTGDGTDLWGYGDKDMTEADKEIVQTVNPRSSKIS